MSLEPAKKGSRASSGDGETRAGRCNGNIRPFLRGKCWCIRLGIWKVKI